MEIAGPVGPERLTWKTSTYCNGGNCIQVAKSGGYVLLGDTKHPDGAVLSYTQSSWERIIHGIQAGSYDHIR